MKVRAFVAVNLGIPVTREVAELAGRVRQDLREVDMKIAWVPPPNLHVTLKFLGYVDEEAMELMAGRLGLELGKLQRFDVAAQGVGAFPSATRPRVLWVGLNDASGRLVKLAGVVDEVMSDLGFKKETRAFHPHITIGRVKDGDGSIEAVVAKHAAAECGTSNIREVVLYESKLRAQGAEYLAHARIPLGSTTQPPRQASSARAQPGEQSKEDVHDGE
jgi:2'-5' RNA ligase